MAMIDIALVAWPNHPKRWQCVRETVASLKRYLTATSDVLQWVCSSESTVDPKHRWYGDELAELCEQHRMTLRFREGKPGLGENMNAALRLCHGDFHLLVQDDRPLQKPLDLSLSVRYLETHRDVALIRYAWPQGKNAQTGQHRTKLMTQPDGWRRFDIHMGWLYGDEPHLRHCSFMERFGWYLENVRHGLAEGEMLHRLRRQRAIVLAADELYFGHNSPDVSAVIDDPRVQGGNR